MGWRLSWGRAGTPVPMSGPTRASQPVDLDVDLSLHLDDLELDESDDEDEPVLRWKDGRLVDTWREGYPV